MIKWCKMLKNDNLLCRKEVKIILKDFYDNREKLKHKKRLAGGKNNATYHVISSSSQKGILIRSAHIDKTNLLSFEKNMMSQEKTTLSMLDTAGIPVPKLLKYVPFGEVIKKEYAIYEYIENDRPIFEKVSKNEYIPPNVDFESLNLLVDKVHEIKGSGFGYVSKPLYSSWYSFIVDLSNELLDIAERHSFFADKIYIEELRKEIADSKEIFEEIKEPIFLRNDIGLKNYLFKQVGDEYRCIYLIDVELSMFGDIDFEFSRAKLTDKFCYDKIMTEHKQNLTPNRIKRLRIYSLLNYLISMHIMKVKYYIPQYFNTLKKQFIEIFDEQNTYRW